MNNTQQPDVKINSPSFGDSSDVTHVAGGTPDKTTQLESVETPGQKVSLGTQVKTDTKVDRSVQDNSPKEIPLISSMVIEGEDAIKAIGSTLPQAIYMDPAIIAAARKKPEEIAEEQRIEEDKIKDYIINNFRTRFFQGLSPSLQFK